MVIVHPRWIIGCILIASGVLVSGPLEWIAHRGGIPDQPENSLGAFVAALPYASAIEADVRFTRDHVPVILHDRTLDRTTECRGVLSEQRWRMYDIAVSSIAPADGPAKRFRR